MKFDQIHVLPKMVQTYNVKLHLKIKSKFTTM